MAAEVGLVGLVEVATAAAIAAEVVWGRRDGEERAVGL